MQRRARNLNYVAVTVTCMNGCKRQKNVYVPGLTIFT
jgi:hypothetical protein